MKYICITFSFFCLIFLVQGFVTARSQDDSTKQNIKKWITQTNEKLTPKIRTEFEALLKNESFKPVTTNISMTEIDLKSASQFNVPEEEKGVDRMLVKTLTGMKTDEMKFDYKLTGLSSFKLDGIDALIAYYGGTPPKYALNDDCGFMVMTVYVKTERGYKKIFCSHDKHNIFCSSKVNVVSLGDKGPYFLNYVMGTSADAGDDLFFRWNAEGISEESLDINVWQGGVYLQDMDGDGTKEVITGLREGFPPDLEKLVGPDVALYLLYRYTIYKWDQTKFDKLAEYYSLQAPPDN